MVLVTRLLHPLLGTDGAGEEVVMVKLLSFALPLMVSKQLVPWI
jgi:hypothetical protein